MEVPADKSTAESDVRIARPSLLVRYPQRALKWQIADQTLTFDEFPKLMGIVNVTPDSFSDGGRFYSVQSAVHHALAMVDDGVDILDIGGESTRPYAAPVDVDEELRRVIPVIEHLRDKTRIPISIDTSKPQVARAAIDAGASIINDVTGLEDSQMLEVAKKSAVGICAMHMQGNPQTMQDAPAYNDVVSEIHGYLAARREMLANSGIDVSRICLDPGIGFGKTHVHNLLLLNHAEHFHSLGCPVLVGHSRKGFLAKILNDKNADRTAATVGVALALAARGIQIIRVHDVRPVREALLGFVAAGGCLN